MLVLAGGACEICRSPFESARAVNVDHDHAKAPGEPGHIRGVLCSHGNTKLGI